MEQPSAEGTDQFDESMDDIFADEVWVPEDVFENQQNYKWQIIFLYSKGRYGDPTTR